MTTESFASARDKVQTWKGVEVKRYIMAMIEAADRLRFKGVDYVGSDDVDWKPLPDLATDDTVHSIPGCAIKVARNAGILADYHGNVEADGVHWGRRTSKRDTTNGRKVQVYSVIWPVADEYMRRNGAANLTGPQLQLGM
jgi:hypothetical protein